MLILDMHTDTLTKVYNTGQSLYSNSYNIDFKRMKKHGNYIQTFAVYIDRIYCPSNAMKRAIELIDVLYQECENHKDDVMLCCNYKDILYALENKKAPILLSIEEGEALQGSIAALRIFYKLGVRSVCLTWNYRNEIADGVAEEISGGGLTVFGREVVKEMNRLGMLIDLSHISERGFWDVIELTTQPIILSHSNAYKIYPHRRNLKDEQIKAVKENGGVIGINFYPYFLNGSNKATVDDVIKHIDHMISIAGEDHIGIGADYDQTEPVFEGIDGIGHTTEILEGLLKRNYPESVIKKIAAENFLRVINEVL
ncbi:MAG TPA: membrane dipeptidase [Clostridiaceae bacterium]|nr:membrane dipeptidase [Clostridiaceae bacterium]